MASYVSHLPSAKNVSASINRWDPVHKSIFEVFFTLPSEIAGSFSEDTVTLTEQVTKVQGLDALQKTTAAGQQKFLGVDVSYSNPVLDNTYAEITMELNLNYRNTNDPGSLTAGDNFVLKVFKAWEKLNYDIADGTRTLKAQYMSDNLRIARANRDGNITQAVIFHNVILTEVTGLDDLDYTSNDAIALTVKFRCDYWDEDLA